MEPKSRFRYADKFVITGRGLVWSGWMATEGGVAPGDCLVQNGSTLKIVGVETFGGCTGKGRPVGLLISSKTKPAAAQEGDEFDIWPPEKTRRRNAMPSEDCRHDWQHIADGLIVSQEHTAWCRCCGALKIQYLDYHDNDKKKIRILVPGECQPPRTKVRGL